MLKVSGEITKTAEKKLFAVLCTKNLAQLFSNKPHKLDTQPGVDFIKVKSWAQSDFVLCI